MILFLSLLQIFPQMVKCKLQDMWGNSYSALLLFFSVWVNTDTSVVFIINLFTSWGTESNRIGQLFLLMAKLSKRNIEQGIYKSKSWSTMQNRNLLVIFCFVLCIYLKIIYLESSKSHSQRSRRKLFQLTKVERWTFLVNNHIKKFHLCYLCVYIKMIYVYCIS